MLLDRLIFILFPIKSTTGGWLQYCDRKMRSKYIVLLLVSSLFVIALSTNASATARTFTIRFIDPSTDPDVTGNGWVWPCKEDCPGPCAEHTPDNNWEPGYHFTSTFTGQASCTLTLRSTSFSVDPQNIGQNQEVVEGKVNGVIFGRTPDICTNDVTCSCDIAQATFTRTITLTAIGNHITVRRPVHSVGIKGAILTCTEICNAGWLDEYRCQGDWVQRLYQFTDCSTEWRNYEECEYGCEDGECIEGCDPGYTNNTRCNGNWLQREWQDEDCSTEWRNSEYCVYGCYNGACNPGPNPYCTDTDGGIIYATQGHTYGIDDALTSYSKSDYCSGNVLYEYYCAATGHTWAVTSITCTDLCVDGECVPDDSCDDECSMYGYRECYGDDGYRICGYYDSDDCLEWSYQSCGPCEECYGNGYCSDDPECDDDCDDGDCDDCDPGYEDEYQCDGNWVQRLYVYSDCDEEWRDWEYCSEGCDDGECEDDDCNPGYQNQYQCSGNWLQRLYTDSDCDDEWRDYQYCSNGCSNGQCNQQCQGGSCGCQTCPSCQNCQGPCQGCQGSGCQNCNQGNCIGEGQSVAVYPGAPPCCAGMTLIGCSTPLSSGGCSQCVGSSICAKCGNGVCGLGENHCNCPADCPTYLATGSVSYGAPQGSIITYTGTSSGISSLPLIVYTCEQRGGECCEDGGEGEVDGAADCPSECYSECNPEPALVAGTGGTSTPTGAVIAVDSSTLMLGLLMVIIIVAIIIAARSPQKL